MMFHIYITIRDRIFLGEKHELNRIYGENGWVAIKAKNIPDRQTDLLLLPPRMSAACDAGVVIYKLIELGKGVNILYTEEAKISDNGNYYFDDSMVFKSTMRYYNLEQIQLKK